MFGGDPVAVDATTGSMMGVDPMRIPYLAQAGQFLGNAGLERVDQRGEDPGRLTQDYALIESFSELRDGLPSGG